MHRLIRTASLQGHYPTGSKGVISAKRHPQRMAHSKVKALRRDNYSTSDLMVQYPIMQDIRCVLTGISMILPRKVCTLYCAENVANMCCLGYNAF